MAKTGLINNEWEGQFLKEVANFKTRDTERQKMTGQNRREAAIKNISDLFDKAITDGDHVGILKLDKLTAFVKDA